MGRKITYITTSLTGTSASTVIPDEGDIRRIAGEAVRGELREVERAVQKRLDRMEKVVDAKLKTCEEATVDKTSVLAETIVRQAREAFRTAVEELLEPHYRRLEAYLAALGKTAAPDPDTKEVPAKPARQSAKAPKSTARTAPRGKGTTGKRKTGNGKATS